MPAHRSALRLLLLVALALPAGCGRLNLPFLKHRTPAPAAADAPPPAPPTAPPGARTADALDTTTEAERKAATAAPAAEGRLLGRTIVSLGNPAEPGFWLRSPLVKAPGKGRAVIDGGASVQVELRPGAAGASQLSLSAYRALGLGLTDLVEVTVHAD